MDRRVVRPFRGARWWLYVALLAPMVMFGFTTILLITTSSAAFRRAMLSSPSLWIPPFFLLAAVAAIVVLLWRGGRVEWHFTDEGFAPGRGPLSLSTLFIPWTAVRSLRFTAVKFFGTASGATLTIDPDPSAFPNPIPLQMAGIRPEAMRTIIAEFIGHVPAENIDPAVLVVEDLLDTTQNVRGWQRANLKKLLRWLDTLQLSYARKLLEKARVLPMGDSTRPWLLLLLAECLYLDGKYRKAVDLANEIVSVNPQWRRALLVGGLSYAQLGEPQRAAAMLGAIQGMGPERAVVGTIQQQVTQTGELRKPRRVKRTVRIVLGMGALSIYLGMEVLYALRPTLPVAWHYVAWAASALFVVLLLASNAIEVMLASRGERQREAAETPETGVLGAAYGGAPVPMAGPSAAARPTVGAMPSRDDAREDRIRTVARWSAYVAIAVMSITVLWMLGTRVVGVLAPDLMGTVGGEWFAERGFMGVALTAIGISTWVIVRAVRMGALRSAKPQYSGIPRPMGMESAPKRAMLNASLSTGWVAAALGVALLCAGAALGLAAWNVPMPDRLTSDGQGNIYAILGDKVYRWDAQGHESLAADLNTAPSMPTDNSGMRVGADGSVYIADMSTTSVMVFGPDGRYKASLKVKARPYSMGARQWNIAVAPTAKGPIVLDSGSLAHFDAYGKPTITPVGGKLYFAQDIEQAADGSTFIADTTHGKVLHVNGTTTQTIDCLGLPDGYCYPSEVRVAPNGDVYAIVRKRWGYKGGAAAALSELAPPDIWMGRLARIDTAIGQASLVDIRFNGVALSTDSVGFQSSGAIVVSALNQGWLYRVDNPSVSTGAERMTVGELGQRSNVVDRNWRVQSLGPQLFFSLAVVLPIGLGVTGVALGRRRKSQWT